MQQSNAPEAPDPQALAAALLRDAALAHYAELGVWLQQVANLEGVLPLAQLNAHCGWLLDQLQRPGQAWHESLPMAVEASARWRRDGVESTRFIIGTTLSALSGDHENALQDFAQAMDLPLAVRERLTNLLAVNEVPASVQIGLARTSTGWSRRLYLERGTMAEHMRAMEWQEDAVHERTYEVHDPLSLESLGEVPEAVRAAWEALIVARPNQPGLLRRDVVGHCVAMHVQLDRKALSTHIPGLLRLADALALPRRPVEAWLDSLPLGTELTVVSLGRDGPLQMNVYVAPRQSGFTQPGPEPSDLRRAPGSVLWQLRLRDGEDTPAWLLFALPDAKLRYRCAAASAGVQVWNGSSVPDGAGLARRLAAVVQPDASTLADRLNLAGPALRAALHDAGLEVTGIHQNTEAEMVPVISQPPVKVLTGDR